LGYEKRREYTIFLEAGFGTTECPEKLKAVGFQVVCFSTPFEYEHRHQISVSDPRIIHHCYKNDYALFTHDKSMRHTHVEVIKKTNIAIIATESFDKWSPGAWIEAFVKARTDIKRHLRKYPRPWFAHLAINGEIRRIETITEKMFTRRVRPHEQKE
jgi:hypothetical protein